jgi:hypothetical protein
MKVNVTNCLDCPFIVEDLDFNSTSKEMSISCNLLKFLNLKRMNYQLYRYFDYEEWFNQHYLEPLEKCPLKNIDKIEIGYEKT